VHALDRLAAIPRADPTFLAWFDAQAEQPEWLERYRLERASWRRQVDTGSGAIEPVRAAAFAAATIEDLRLAWEELLDGRERATALLALRRADEQFQSSWKEIEPALRAMAAGLEAELSGPVAESLYRELAVATHLAAHPTCSLDVVLVARPPGVPCSALHEGPFLVLECAPLTPTRELLAALFHELAHVAVERGGTGAEVERGCVGRGRSGLLAANLWNEVFATAFGNGRAAAAFGATTDRPWYDMPAVDALARALCREWQRGDPPSIGEQFAARMQRLVDEHWPRERWSVQEVCFRYCGYAEEPEVLRVAARDLGASLSISTCPLDGSLARPAHAPPTCPRLVLATHARLSALGSRLDRWGIDWQDWRERSREQPFLAHVGSDADDLPVIVIGAPSETELPEAVRAFARLARMPEAGWVQLAP
jgi:hypothetical protein